ncbi:MAG TPA: hypothetical protein VFS38_07530, partial [Actinomycetota bacterium]|nr:hypothetical protein [Actinomycetota bacterium]
MAGELRFHHWKRSTAAKGATFEPATGRLRGHVDLTLSELVSSGRLPESQSLPFDLMGPADVAGLRPGAVTHTYPAPGAADVEVTKSPYAEFAEPDLPWRYTVDPFPQVQTAGNRPWLVLVVGTTEEMWLGRGTVTFTGTVVGGDPPLDLDQSARWVHVQAYNNQEVARLLCPRKLKPSHDYLAVIVPAYKEDGTNSWDVQSIDEDQPVTIAAYYWWHFRTTDTTKDFRILATDILPRPVAPENRIGVAPLAYYTDDTRQPALLEVGGALTTPAPTPP